MEGTVIKAREGMMTGIAETMTGIDMTTVETLMIVVKAITNRDPMTEAW
jgi:quinol monooxygenase YgiN